MTLTKEDIKTMLNEKFKKQEKSLMNIISGNAKLQNEKMDSLISSIQNLTTRINKIESRQDDIEKEVSGLKESIEFT